MEELNRLRSQLSNMRYDLEYTELSPSQRGCIDWELEYELEAAVEFSDWGAGI
jgi:hypothetical protein